MATHENLTSLFSDTADAIRVKTGGTAKIIADNFPTAIRNITTASSVPATQWDPKYLKILSPSLSNTTANITVKALCYYDNYWYGVGNDSSGDAYKIYGTTTGTLTVIKYAESRTYPTTGIVCDGTNVWVCSASGGYGNRFIHIMSISDFRSSSSNTYSNVQNDGDGMVDAFKTDNYMYFVGERRGGAAILSVPYGGSSTDTIISAPTAITSPFISGCSYNNKPTAVTGNGTITTWDTTTIATASNMNYATLPELNGAKKIMQMGSYLCVTSTKQSISGWEDGTYLHFTSDTNPITSIWSTFKISDEILTIVGMAYAGGVYIVISYDNSGVTKVWQTTNILDHGVHGHPVTLSSGYIPKAMASTGDYICILSDNGSKVEKALATIT